MAQNLSGAVLANFIIRSADMQERREREDRDRGDDRRFRDDRDRCKPHYGDIVERIEILKRVPPDDAIEILKTIIDAAFYAGATCACMRCECEHEEREEDRFDRRRGRRDD
jgi:hypothetical protein